MIITESAIVILDGKCHQLNVGDKIIFSEDGGKTVSKDAEVMLDGERYFIEKGDKIILTEDLFGFKVMRGSSPIDMLIAHVDANMLDWDITDNRFLAAAKQFLGNVPSDGAEWAALIGSSAQVPTLKQHLIMISNAQAGAAMHGDSEDEGGSPSDASPSDGSPSDLKEAHSGSPSDGSPSDDDEDKPKVKKSKVEGSFKIKKHKAPKKKKSSSGSPSDGSPSD